MSRQNVIEGSRCHEKYFFHVEQRKVHHFPAALVTEDREEREEEKEEDEKEEKGEGETHRLGRRKFKIQPQHLHVLKKILVETPCRYGKGPNIPRLNGRRMIGMSFLLPLSQFIANIMG